MANEQNLKSWKPGQSGNPKGKPKGTRSIKHILRDILSGKLEYKDSIDGTMKKMQGTEALAHSAIRTALNEMVDNPNNKLKAIDMILDRLEGKPTQFIEQKEVPTTNEDAIENLKEIAEQEGISIQELCDREGINYNE